MKTKTVFKSLNPVWNETFEFEVDTSDPGQELRLEMWDYDRFASDDFMGICSVPVYTLVGKKESTIWLELLPRPGKKDTVSGQVCMTLSISEGDSNAEQSNLQFAKQRDRRFIDIVSPEVLGKLTPKERKRQEIIFEMINTEDQYVKDVQILINSFLVPIRQRNLLKQNEIESLFANVESILPVNQAMLDDFLARQKENPVIEKIGDILVKHAPNLELYTKYCSNQTLATDFVDEYRIADPNFAVFIDEPREECRKLPLQGFLVKPLQRLCKYPLLLRVS